jgi:hypothetical protein
VLGLDAKMRALAETLRDAHSLLFFARGNNFATALEAALKVARGWGGGWRGRVSVAAAATPGPPVPARPWRAALSCCAVARMRLGRPLTSPSPLLFTPPHPTPPHPRPTPPLLTPR